MGNQTQPKAEMTLRSLGVSLRILIGACLAAPAFTTHAQPALRGQAHRGEAAVQRFQNRVPEIARKHRVAAQELVTLLRTQRGLAIDDSESLLFICEGLPASAQSAQPVNGSIAEALAVESTDPFQLHSFPGASRVIYLDFNGHTTQSTQWNSSFNGGANIVSQPFNADAATIRAIWRRVAEDYAPFAIDVTTQDPGIEALRRSSSGDSAFGVRVVISPTNWYSGSAGGVAYVGSFDWNTDTPCFIFAEQLANGEKYIAEAISHEVGHTLGLFHDGKSGSGATEYYQGHGSWAPIMGVSYYKSVTQFSRGEYSGANNTQDDFNVITGFAPLATDDHGNTLGTASTLSGPTVSDGGTIERNSDVDIFRFSTDAGAISLSIQGPSPEPNLDIKAELLDANGQVLQTSDPTGLNATIATNLGAGTYYLRISGVGAGDPQSTGYSTYGSVGNYVITGTLAGALSAPTITVPSNIVAEATSASGAVVTFTTTATSSGTSVPTSNSPASGSTFPLGITTVTTTATYNGVTATQTFTVTVRDTTPPTITVPANMTVAATGTNGAVVTFTTSATDIVSGARPTTNTPASGSTFAVGTTTVTTTASDAAGNSGNRTFLVTVTAVTPPPAAPTGLSATAGDGTVTLGWSAVSGATSYNVKRSTVSGGPYALIASGLASASYTNTGLTNGTTYYYVVTASNGGGESAQSAQAIATPVPPDSASTAFVTNAALGTLRNDYTGWVGMRMVIGTNPVTVSQLGRMVAPGNSGTHALKLVRASDGTDVPGGATTVNLNGGVAGSFRYASLATPVTLAAGATYYLLSQESAGGDAWYDYNTQLTTTNVATAASAAHGSGGSWHTYGTTNQSYAPVNFIY
jgi:hypothetical protein